MALYDELCAIYQRAGYTIVAGVPREFSEHPSTEFTWLFHDGVPQTHHLGVSPLELQFLASLFESLKPRHILVVGNSFGWSSFALAMLNPGAHVVSLDAGEDDFTLGWIERSNAIARREGLSATAVHGRSPQDVPRVVEAYLGGRVDFAFIDGEHSPQQVAADFGAIRAYGAPDAAYLFHDIVSFALWKPFFALAAEADLPARLMLGTTSGIGLMMQSDLPAPVEQACRNFGATEEAAALIDHFRAQTHATTLDRVLAAQVYVDSFRDV